VVETLSIDDEGEKTPASSVAVPVSSVSAVEDAVEASVKVLSAGFRAGAAAAAAESKTGGRPRVVIDACLSSAVFSGAWAGIAGAAGDVARGAGVGELSAAAETAAESSWSSSTGEEASVSARVRFLLFVLVLATLIGSAMTGSGEGEDMMAEVGASEKTREESGEPVMAGNEDGDLRPEEALGKGKIGCWRVSTASDGYTDCPATPRDQPRIPWS
jgi:hypothetical protein